MSLDDAEIKRIYSVLDKIKDPEIGVSIVRLGMVKSVEFKDGTLGVIIKLTVPNCPLTSKIETDVKSGLNQTYANINVSFEQMSKEDLEAVKGMLQRSSGKIPSPIRKYDKKSIKKIVAVYSAKGGVGKSTIVGLLALEAKREGYKTGILDCDVSGPSIQTIFGMSKRVYLNDDKSFDPINHEGIKIISVDMLTDAGALIWRGPLVTGALKQMYGDTNWGDLDILFLDMPPGTSDGPLTVFQSIPVDEVLLVTTPQSLSNVIGNKTLSIANALKIPVSGVIENMSYIKCDHCNKHMEFNRGYVDKLEGVKVVCHLPFEMNMSSNIESGMADKEIVVQLKSALKAVLKETETS